MSTFTDAARWRECGYPDIDHTPVAVLVDLVRRGTATTRGELVVASGLGRRVVDQRVDEAIAVGLLENGELAPSRGGRPSRTVRFRASAGAVAAIVLGVSEMTVGVLDLEGGLVASEHRTYGIGQHGPEATLQQATAVLESLVQAHGLPSPWAFCVGVPLPVDPRSHAIAQAACLPGWEGFNPRAWLRSRYDAPVWVDNDAKLMARGELATSHADSSDDLLFVKIGSTVEAGIILDGRVVHGHRGGAGHIGHLPAPDNSNLECRCGRSGCLDAAASGWSILRQATERAEESPLLEGVLRANGRLTLSDIGRACRAEDRLALALCARAIDLTSEVVARVAGLLDPKEIILGGGFLEVGDWAVARFQEQISSRMGVLARDDLTIRASASPHRSGLIGAGALVLSGILSPAALSHWIADGTPRGKGALLQASAVRP